MAAHRVLWLTLAKRQQTTQYIVRAGRLRCAAGKSHRPGAAEYCNVNVYAQLLYLASCMYCGLPTAVFLVLTLICYVDHSDPKIKTSFQVEKP